MLPSGIEHLSQLIDPETCGIIWLTDEPLDYETPGSYEVNYLLNGILTKSLADKETEEETEEETDKEKDRKAKEATSNFFLGENFGRRFFVLHCVVKSKPSFKEVFKNLGIADPFIPEGGQVFVLNKSKNTAGLNVLKELQNKRKEINFEHLTI